MEWLDDFGYSPDDRFVFALNASGWDTFDEIIRARSTLYQRVYLHAVTRTAEAVFARALRINAESALAEKPADSNLRDAVALWGETDDSIVQRITNAKDPEVSQLGAGLRDRKLPKKACAIGGGVVTMQVSLETLLPSVFGAPQHASNEADLYRLVSNQYQRLYTIKHAEAVDALEFENEIRAEAIQLAKILEVIDPALAPQEDLNSVSFIAIAALDNPSAEAPVFQHGELLTADAFTNIRGVSDAVDHFRQAGYVMAPSEWREIVLIATRNVLYARSESFPPKPLDALVRNPADGVITTKTIWIRPLTLLGIDEVVRRVGASKVKLDRILSVLSHAGAFDERPLLTRRTSAGAALSIEKKYSAFHGEEGWRIEREGIAAFVDQVPPELRQSLMECLEKGIYLSRDQVAASLTKCLQKLQKELGLPLVLVPLSPSSGGWVLHSLKQLVDGEKFLKANSLTEGLATVRAAGHLVLIDDNAASGTQASAQLYAYVGINRADWPKDIADETGVFVDSLTPEQLEQMKTQNFTIAVAVGHNRGQERIANATEALGLLGYKGLKFDQEIGATVKWPPLIRNFFEEVGRELISGETYKKKFAELSGTEKTRCSEHCFGYGNFGGLTVLPTTVPASTVTALWMPGTWKGRPWVPLFLRWGYFKSAVFC